MAALGLIGALLTVFRMVDPPNPMPEFLTLTLRFGVYTTLLGCVAIIAGAVWPSRTGGAAEDAPADARRLVGAVRLDAELIRSSRGACARRRIRARGC